MAEEFLGKGLRFPLAVAPDGSLAVSSEEDKVRESVLLILSTAAGERQMRPEFGSRIREQVFAAIRPATISRLSFQVQEALVAWEPRIEVQSVRVEPDKSEDGLLLISIDYKIRATNTAFNLVYPFFVQGFAG